MYVQKRAPDDGPSGLDTHAQIAIGVIIPVVVLLGGLLLFIWHTEKQRRQRVGEPLSASFRAPARPKITSYLHRSSKALTGIPTSQVDFDTIEIVRPHASDAKMHELEDTGRVELVEMQKTLNRLNDRLNRDDDDDYDDRERTMSPRNINERNDSAIEAAAARLESRDTNRSHEGPERKALDTTKMEHMVQTPRESKRHSRTEYRSSPQPEYRSSLKPGVAKREARVASNRYSKEVRYTKDLEARFSKDAAARANVEQRRDLHSASKHTTNGRMSLPGAAGGFTNTGPHHRDQDDRDSTYISPSKESLEQQQFTFTDINSTTNPHHLSASTSASADTRPLPDTIHNISDTDSDCSTISDISPTTNRNSALSTIAVLPDSHRTSQRWSSGVPPSEMPSWMKRLSVQDTVEAKWRSDGEIVAPEPVRLSAGSGQGDGGMRMNGGGVVSPTTTATTTTTTDPKPSPSSHVPSTDSVKLLLLSAAESARSGRPHSHDRRHHHHHQHRHHYHRRNINRSLSPGVALTGDETSATAANNDD